jgi:hypothetical protein
MNSQTILMSQTLQRCRCLDLGFTVAVVEALAFLVGLCRVNSIPFGCPGSVMASSSSLAVLEMPSGHFMVFEWLWLIVLLQFEGHPWHKLS